MKSNPEIYKRRILTSKEGPRAERVNMFGRSSQQA